jgi:hypothetical protein
VEFGTLKEEEVRKLWKHEQYDFSAWIARDNNIELLNDVLGLTLIEIDREVYVGPFRCDIVAKDETTGIKVIIENQLAASDHEHLGKIITYASGLDAAVMVWIVTQAKEEHRSAIEWLNNNTNKDINFFLIELHAYSIGNSLPAPKFEPVEKPNEFIKTLKGKGSLHDLNKSEASRLDFWTMFNNSLDDRGKPFNKRKATTDHWYDVSIGTSEAYIRITLVNKEGYIGIELHIDSNKGLFDSLYEKRDEIENELALQLDWQRLDKKKASRILFKMDGLNFSEPSNYEKLMNDVIDKTIVMKKVFIKYILSSFR